MLNSSTTIGKLLRLPLRLVPKKAVLPVLSGPLQGARWVAGASNHGCWLGWYERAKVQRFVGALKPGLIVYDVGANVGYYTLLAARYCPAGRIFAFEPLPSNVELLKRHVDLNGVRHAVIHECAVSNREGEALFRAGPTNAMGHLASQGDMRVRVSTLDAMIERGEIMEPDLIKMDIEGGEVDAVRGAMALLRRRHPLFFLATHGREVHAACCQLLKSLDYVLMSVDRLPLETTSELCAIRPDA